MISPFGDWRVRLGIVSFVLLFCAGVITYSLLWPSSEPVQAQSVQAAWWSLTLITGAMLGFSALSDRNAAK